MYQMWHFLGRFVQFRSQIGDLRPVKTSGNYDVGDFENQLKREQEIIIQTFMSSHFFRQIFYLQKFMTYH